jgi:uncharacterized membrane protein YfcA
MAVVVFVFIASIQFVQQYTLAEAFMYWWMFPIALIVALIVNTVGVSGASLFVPFFILVFPAIAGFALSPIHAVQLGLITESFGLSSSAIAFIMFGLVDTYIVFRSILVALPFVFLGVSVVAFIPDTILELMVAGLLVIAIVLLKYSKRLETKRAKECRKGTQITTTTNSSTSNTAVTKTDVQGHTYTYDRAVGIHKRSMGYGVGGLFQGATGFGIGELGIVSMFLSRIPVRIAIGTSHLIVAVSAITAALIHFTIAHFSTTDISSSFPWAIPMMAVPAVVIGGQIAPYVAARLSANALEKAVSSLFIIIAVALILVVIQS